MSHTGFILGAYGAAAIVVGGLVGWVLFDWLRLRRALATLEARGARRRSSAGQGRRAAS